MISIRSSDDLERALPGLVDEQIRKLLIVRCDQLTAYGGYELGDIVHIILVTSGDTLPAIEAMAGFPIITGVDGDGPSVEFVERHGTWLEAVTILSDDGFGIALFVQDTADTDPAILLPLLRLA